MRYTQKITKVADIIPTILVILLMWMDKNPKKQADCQTRILKKTLIYDAMRGILKS